MIFLDENNHPISLDSIDIQTTSEYFWALSLKEMDFMLTKIETLEELTTPSLTLAVMDNVIHLPANWNILVYSKETSQLDIIEVHRMTRMDFSIVLYNHVTDIVDTEPIDVRVIDYDTSRKLKNPSLHKDTMMCHPIGHYHWM